MPRTQRLKFKVKKFVFLKLIFRSVSASATANIQAVDLKIRFGGDAK